MVLGDEQILVQGPFLLILHQKTNLEDCISWPVLGSSVAMFTDNNSGTLEMNN